MEKDRERTKIDRRSILKASGAAAVAGTVGAGQAIAGTGDAELRRLFEAWRSANIAHCGAVKARNDAEARCHEAANAAVHYSKREDSDAALEAAKAREGFQAYEAAVEAAQDALMPALEAIADTPAETMVGVEIKMATALADDRHGMEDHTRDLLESAMADLKVQGGEDLLPIAVAAAG